MDMDGYGHMIAGVWRGVVVSCDGGEFRASFPTMQAGLGEERGEKTDLNLILWDNSGRWHCVVVMSVSPVLHVPWFHPSQANPYSTFGHCSRRHLVAVRAPPRRLWL